MACCLCRDLSLNNVTMMQIFGLSPAESEIDVYSDMKEVVVIGREVCCRKI